uniref:Ras and Rab interactor 3 n=1 Tax=Cavia porcellus TaxID=10141 RepID=A0A286XMB8_CAVPO
PVPDVGKGEGEEEEEEDSMGLRLAATSKNYLPHRGISILEKLIKTCPVWLQLGLDQAEVTRILHREVAGLCGEASAITQLPVCSLFSSQSGLSPLSPVLYLEGSVLVFEDIFKLIAFYCVSRDLLPFTLRLPQAILEASSFTDLETISNLGLGKSSLWEQMGLRAEGGPLC